MPEVDYAQVEHLAGQTAWAATRLNGGATGVDRAPQPGAGSFGDTEAGGPCRSAYLAMADSGAGAAQRLVQVLVSDESRLREVIAAYQSTDSAAAAEMRLANPTLDVFSAHVHSGGDADDDFLRATQIDRLADAAAGVSGPSVVNLDANVSLDAGDRADHDDLAVDALGRFPGELGYTDAGDVGPTSDHGDGRRIDYVFTSEGLRTGDPERVQGGPSDHDGQSVDVDRPWW